MYPMAYMDITVCIFLHHYRYRSLVFPFYYNYSIKMDVEEYKKFAQNKLEAEALTKKVRDKIKTTIWGKQNMRKGFKETSQPLIESQDSVKESIDKQQEATIEQLKKINLLLQVGYKEINLQLHPDWKELMKLI